METGSIGLVHGVPKHKKQVTFSDVSPISTNERPDTSEKVTRFLCIGTPWSKGVAMEAVALICHEQSLKEGERNAPVNKGELIIAIILGFG